MLPVYPAISFQRVLEKGGRTKPWLVLVNAGESIKPYVVKLFKTEMIQELDSVTKEVLGNVLAKEFDLPVPDAAFIRMDRSFINTITDPQLKIELGEKDGRLKFGTALLDDFVRFDTRSVSLTEVRRIIEIDQVFAFDNLIRNPDRNEVKPNLLVRSDEAYLIDHELGFDIAADSLSELDDWQWKERFYRYHIFYEHLKRTPHTPKKDYFNAFEECLKRLNVNLLVPCFDQLADHGYPKDKQALILHYLAGMKQKSTNFVNLLRGLIS